MFTDDTDLLCLHKYIYALFFKVNNEFHKINQWFISNKLSLNIKNQKQNIHFSINEVKKMIFPLLPKLKTNNK